VNPKAEIRIGGGREGHLRGLQALALYPANSLFVEGYLATRGHSVDQVYQLIQDAGFEIAGDETVRDDSCGSKVRTSAEQYQLDDNPNILNPQTTTV
jgi:biotin synthase